MSHVGLLEPLLEVVVPELLPAFSVQRPSATCTQTWLSVWDVRRPAAWLHVVKGPIEQID